MRKTLTKKRRAFVNHYADSGNGTQAALKTLDVTNDNSAAASASRLLRDVNVQEELKKLGFDSNNAKRVIGEILNNENEESKDRIKAAENVFKVNGDYAPEKKLNVNVEVESSPELEEAAKVLNEHFKRIGIQSNGVETSVMDTETQDKE